VTTGYKLPRGSWFDRLDVNCPHFLAEIATSCAIGLSLLDQSPFTYSLLIGYTVLSHAHLAYNKQLFYRAKFREELSASRAMIVPRVF
jgi:hypothetical protein